MLTRIEIDGFKSFERFALDLPPFAIVLGPNASGKSNLFDALQLLSQLAQSDVRSAMRDLRGEPHELFRHFPDREIASRIAIAAELLLPSEVQDDYGQTLKLSCTRLRYEVTIERRLVSGIERFYVFDERAVPIKTEKDRWQPNGMKPSDGFRRAFIRYSQRRTEFLDTVEEDARRSFHIHQDNKQGRIRKLPAHEAERTVLSTITLAQEFPHLFALRRELAGLRYLQLDPAAERRPSSLDAPETLERDGANLAAVLYRMQQETADEHSSHGVLADILGDLSEIIPGVLDLEVERDDQRREYRLAILTRDGQRFSSRVVSDGTLRVLSLLALLHDRRQQGTLCFEEPENGVHKTRLEALMRLLQESCADPTSREDGGGPLLQIIVNTHSPVAARAVKDSIVLAKIAESASGSRRRTLMTPYAMSEQAELFGTTEHRATMFEIEQMLKDAERQSIAA